MIDHTSQEFCPENNSCQSSASLAPEIHSSTESRHVSRMSPLSTLCRGDYPTQEQCSLAESRNMSELHPPQNTEKSISCIPWVEKYRPLRFQDIVLDPLNRELFQSSLQKGYFPNMLFYGPPGTGKTTTIINLINEYQERYNRKNKSTVIHLNASDERGIDIIRSQINQFVRSLNLFESGMKFVVLDEVDYMTKNAQQALKYILQTCNTNVCFCLICNYITKIDESLKNEFLCIRFNQLPRTEIIIFIKYIAKAECLHIDEDTIIGIQENYKSDIRSMINYIQMNRHLFTMSPGVRPYESFQDASIKGINLLKKPILDKLLSMMDKKENCIPFIHELSIIYNMDKRSILQSLYNHIIRMYPERITPKFLDSIELFLHRHDIPINLFLH